MALPGAAALSSSSMENDPISASELDFPVFSDMSGSITLDVR